MTTWSGPWTGDADTDTEGSRTSEKLDNFGTLYPIFGVVKLQTLTLTWSQAVPRVLQSTVSPCAVSRHV